MTGEQLIEKINERIEDHNGNAEYYEKLAKHPASDRDNVCPQSVCEGEAARSRRQIVTLTLIRDHIVPNEVYRLGEFDLQFANLLPEDNWIDDGCDQPRAGALYPELTEQLADK
jgi:hypothetical protein